LLAQEHRVAVQNPKESTVIISDFYDKLPIEGYAGNEIVITASGGEFGNPPERAKGLKAIYPGGTDNTGLGVSVEQSGNEIQIKCLAPITHHEGSYRIKVPESVALRIESGCERDNSVEIDNMKNEVEVNVCQGIRLRNVSGPVVLSSISGDIDVAFGQLSGSRAMSIAAISGEVDVILPAKAPVNLEMSNVSGNMYSDFEFNQDHQDLHRVGGNSISAKLNGGGADLKITNVSGNIYIRKG
ncbi:MAG TPA: DUF4097 family beta strand repeat-containing protein, partial [Puia sp.]|nr:DUF4097 family beta strand repeat-containing protein [Puia sp.]